MPQSQTRRRKGRGEIVPPLSKQELIEDCLRIQLETFPQKELTPDEITRWAMDLSHFSEEAIKFAFEEHRLMAIFFPVPGQIIDLARTWQPSAPYKPGCSAECKSRHDRGYGESDVLWLLKRYMAVRSSLPNRALTDSEISKLYDELDQKRGQSPAWRA